MMTESGGASNETQIRELIEARAEAVRAKDLAGATADVAPDVLVSDVIDPLRYSGSDAVRERAEQPQPAPGSDHGPRSSRGRIGSGAMATPGDGSYRRWS